MRYLSLIFGLFAFAAVAVVPDDANDVQPLLPGQVVPEFSAVDATGKSLTFSTFSKPAVFIFYRGGWCPFCNMYWAELRKYEQQLLDLNVDLYFVSSDSPDALTEALEDGPKRYTLLSDSEGKVAEKFGVAFRVDDATYKQYVQWGIDIEQSSQSKSHILPAPAAFIVGTDGQVKFNYVNPDYKVRLHPEVLVSAVKHMLDYEFKMPK